MLLVLIWNSLGEKDVVGEAPAPTSWGNGIDSAGDYAEERKQSLDIVSTPIKTSTYEKIL